MFSYEIEGEKFIQKSLVWGQVKQLKELFQNVRIKSDFSEYDMIDLLGEHLPTFCAIVLRKEGQELKDKNLEELGNLFSEILDVTTSVKVVEDFLVCNPIDSISKSLSGLGQMAKGLMPMRPVNSVVQETPLTQPSVPSQEEILPSEI